jgi:RNA exonuclease 1
MFPSLKSPTFGKLKCPQISETGRNDCPFGPQNCIFSHDPNVYTRGSVDGRIGLSSMTYFKDLHQRIRSEASALQSSDLTIKKSDNPNNIPYNIPNNELSGELEKNLNDFLLPPPAGCKISRPLRQKVLRKIMLWLRQADASSTLAQAAEIEFDHLARSGGRISSIYLSSISQLLKNPPPLVNNCQTPSKDDMLQVLQKLRALIATRADMDTHSYPIVCAPGQQIVDSSDSPMRRCRRCGVNFNAKVYYAEFPLVSANSDRCRFHGGKVEKIDGARVHSCCQELHGHNPGCETQDWHVYETFNYRSDPIPHYNHLPLPSLPQQQQQQSEPAAAVALDAEMSYTVGGYEVSRVTLVDFFSESTLLDVLVRPDHPVIDYNTKYSGVSRESYESGELPVMSFDEMRAALAQFIGRDTLLMGHSLDNDLRVLKVKLLNF